MTMKAGTYVISDLCYLFTNEQWNEMCDDFDKNFEGESSLSDGTFFANYSTMYGDGSYSDNCGFRDYGVDSGSIGCVSIEFVDKNKINKEYMNVVEFTKDFETGYHEGIITFGHIHINTGYEETEEEWEEYEEEE